MSMINLGKIKFSWKGDWTPTTAYTKDDVVKYGPNSYVCITAHTSGANFADESAKFELMTEGVKFDTVEYNPSTTYTANTFVKYQDTLYISLTDTTGNLPTDTDFWSLVSVVRPEGNVWYVAANGLDTRAGTDPSTAFATIKYALSVAQSGDTVKIAPGTFEEVFPLTVPQGVAVVGSGIRATKITPTSGTNDLDCFLLNGETGIADLTVSGMLYNSDDNTGYAFRFAPNTTITLRSPYIERVTVLNQGSITSSFDPYGFLQGDAGRGALVDGSQVTRSSLEAALLFNECTFIVPNSRALIMTNGGRVEWLTCFTYFADLAIEGVAGSSGRGGDGKTIFEFGGVSGDGFEVGEVIRVTSTDASSTFDLTVDSIVGNTIYVDGKYDLLEGEDFTPGSGGSIVGLTSETTATSITRYDRGEFAAELRAISGANIYGNQAVKADGDDVVLQLMAWNFAYIGTGADLSNDDTAVIQANEVIEVNGGRVYYNSVDQVGNFRVGDLFTVDFSTGNVTFQAPEFNVSSLTGINFTDGSNTTIIDPTQVSTGNIIISGNAISTTTGDITLDPGGSEEVIVNANTNIIGDLDVTGDVSIGGNITIGNQTLDTVTVVADFTSNLTPDVANTYDLGKIDQAWRQVFAQSVYVTGTGYVKLPVGTTAQRPTAETGMIRYNSDLSSFEGYANSNWQGLGGVKSVDGFTYIVPETSPAASNGELEFYAENTAGNGSTKIAGMTNSTVTIPVSTASTSSSTGALVVTGGVGIGGNVTLGGELRGPASFVIDPAGVGDNTGTVVIRGNLQVDGTTTTINSTTLTVDDKNIELASVASPTDLTADGAGITIKGTSDKTFNWVDATNSFTANQNIDVLSGFAFKVAGVDKVTETTLFPNGDVTIGGSLSTVTINDEILINNFLITNGDVISDNTTQVLYSDVVDTISMGASATSISLGSTEGVGFVTVKNNLDVDGIVRIQGNSISTKPETVVLLSSLIGNLAAGQSGQTTTTDGIDAQFEIEFEKDTGLLLRVTLISGGTGWVANSTPFVGDLLYIRGSELGGLDGGPAGQLPATGNDIIIAVTAVNTPKVVVDGVPNDNTGVITQFAFQGIPPVIDSGLTTFSLLENFVEEVDFAKEATTITMGAVNSLGQPDGTTTVRHNMQVNGDLTVAALFTGAIGSLSTNTLEMNLFNENATKINFGGDSNTISIGSEFGTTTVNNELRVPSGIVADMKGSIFGDFSSKIVDGITGDITANDLQVNGVGTFEFDIVVKGGDIVTNQTTFNLINDTATTLNIGQAATGITMGAETGTFTIQNANTQLNGDLDVAGGNITTGSSIFNIANSGALEFYMGGSAQTVGIGSSLGSTTINNALTVRLNATIEGTDLTTTNTTFNLVNTTAETVNFAGDATIINVGNSTGTTVLNSAITEVIGDLKVQGGDLIADSASFNLLQTPTTINFADSATTLQIAAGSGTTTIRNNTVVTGDLTVDGGDLKSSASTFNLLNEDVSTINLGGAASTVNIGFTNGSTNIRHNANIFGVLTVGSADSTVSTIESADTSFYLANTTAENLYMGGAATVVEIGSTTGTTSINNDLAVDGAATFEQDVLIKGGDLTTNQSTFNLVNTTASTVNLGGAATSINIGSTDGNTVVRNNLQVDKDVEIRGGDLTTNQATFNLINGNATTVNFAGGANTVNIAAPGSDTNIAGDLNVTGITNVSNHILPTVNEAYDLGSSTNRFRDLYLSGNTINLNGGTISYDGTSFNFQGGTNVGQSVDTNSQTFDLLNSIATTINFGGAATTINLGAFTGSTNIRNNLAVAGQITLGSSDSSTSTLDVTDTSFFLANSTAETIYFGGAATSVNIGAVGGNTTFNTGITVTGDTLLESDLTVNGNLTLTSLNTTGENNDFNISPQGSGRVIIEPEGGLTIRPNTTGEVNNVNIGATQRGTGAFTTLAANGQTTFTAGTSSTDSTTGSVVVQGGIGVGENLNVEGNISANSLTLRGTVLFDNELAVPSGGTGAGQFNARGVLYGNSTAPLQSTAGSDYLNPYTGTNQQTSNAILTTNSQGVPVWSDVIDCGTF
jgi:hypothetical protein